MTLEKLTENPYADLKWNIPERKQGRINVIGGNVGNFRTEVKVAEYLTANYPLELVNVVLPDVLQDKLPPVPGLVWLKSTDSGSLADAEELTKTIEAGDYNILVGDLSKNNVTAKAVAEACRNASKPLLITRDAVDVVAENATDELLMNENLVFFASVAQLIKLLRAVYYPKMLLMSQSLVQVAEILHKFTLSYPANIITLHSGQILVAQNGKVVAVSLEKSGYTPITIWNGELASKIATLNLYNPHNFIPAAITAIM